MPLILQHATRVTTFHICYTMSLMLHPDRITLGLPMAGCIELFQTANTFQAALESFGHGCSTDLQGALLLQGKRCLDSFHGQQKEKLSVLLENESWVAVSTPPEYQSLLDSITYHANIPPSAGDEVSSSSKRTSRSAIPTVGVPTGPIVLLVIGETSFCVVGATLNYVKILHDYIAWALLIPSLSADVLMRLADSLRSFNIRLNRLVL